MDTISTYNGKHHGHHQAVPGEEKDMTSFSFTAIYVFELLAKEEL